MAWVRVAGLGGGGGGPTGTRNHTWVSCALAPKPKLYTDSYLGSLALANPQAVLYEDFTFRVFGLRVQGLGLVCYGLGRLGLRRAEGPDLNMIKTLCNSQTKTLNLYMMQLRL